MITFGEVATHNHFALVRKRYLFAQAAPVILLRQPSEIDDYFDVLGVLNSSCVEFWGKHRFQNKGYSVERFRDRYQRSSKTLRSVPLPTRDREARIALAAALDATAAKRAACLPDVTLASHDWTPGDIVDRIATARSMYRNHTNRMVALQEELDWLSYRSYGLLFGHDTVDPDQVEPLAPGHRPFEIHLARQNAAGEPEESSEWFKWHGHAETTTIPEHYSPGTRDRLTRRLQIIAANNEIQLIEQPHFKRRWQLADSDGELKDATRNWLLDRLEDLFAPAEDDDPAGPLSTPQPYRLEEILAALTVGEQGARVLAVAKIFAGNADVDLAAIVEGLLRDNAIPDNPYRVYTAEGIRKLRTWQQVWALQDREDAGEKVRIPEPREFGKEDFASPRYLQIRGSLNVPRERFILFTDISPPHYGWNGWRDRDRALAQVEAFTLAETHPTDPLPLPTVDDPRRCGATLGLWESLPDVKRWGNPATKEGEYGELHALAQEACQKTSCPCEIVKEWQLWKDGKRALGTPGETDATQAAATIEERALLAEILDKIGETGAIITELATKWPGPAPRLALVIDDLLASGDVSAKGRGKNRRYRGKPAPKPQQELFAITLPVRSRKKKANADQ